MASTIPLTGSELIDCARANSSKGLEVVASRCGYGNDIAAFQAALRQAGEHIGIDIGSFDALIHPDAAEAVGVEVSPESLGHL